MASQRIGTTVAPDVLQVQHRIGIARRYRDFIASQSNTEMADLIIQNDYKLLYRCKTGGVRVVAQNNADFAQEELEEIRTVLIDFLYSREDELFPNKPRINLYDVATLGMPFLEYLQLKSLQVDTLSPTLQAEFGAIESHKQILDDLITQMQEFSYMTGIMWSSYEKGFCYIYADFIYPKDRKTKVFSFIAKRIYPEIGMLKIGRRRREAFRVAWFHMNDPLNKLMHHDLTPAELGINHSKPNKPLKIYIQQHAISRIYERLDSINPSSLLLTIFSTIREPVTVAIKEKRLFIEVRWAKIKVGYFVASVEEEFLLIHTFLFITGNGTPEGVLLRTLTGLELLDMKFLALDRLSSFVTEEVTGNAQIREIFDKAGCGNLFNEKLQKYSGKEYRNRHTPAVKLPTYIGSNTQSTTVEELISDKINPTTISLTQWARRSLQSVAKRLMGMLKNLWVKTKRILQHTGEEKG